jgi:hypothetical protein
MNNIDKQIMKVYELRQKLNTATIILSRLHAAHPGLDTDDPNIKLCEELKTTLALRLLTLIGEYN